VYPLPPPPRPPARPEPKEKQPASSWALGPWLGSLTATATAALASVQGSAKARADNGGDGGPLYIDRDGNAHLGVHAGDDKELFTAMRQVQVRMRGLCMGCMHGAACTGLHTRDLHGPHAN